MYIVFGFSSVSYCFFIFFFNDTATTEIYTLSLHDALPIWGRRCLRPRRRGRRWSPDRRDRKSTRLNSSHITISYAVFCLKKKKKKKISTHRKHKQNNNIFHTSPEYHI